jgi:hypothetical protein
MRWRNGVQVCTHRRGCGPIVVGLLGILTAGIVSGCTASDGLGSFIVDPGHYSVYHCKDFGARLSYLLTREQQLHELMEKASEGSGGAVIGNLSYRAEYEDMLGEEKVLRRAAAEKNCELPPPAATASPAVAPAPIAATPSAAPAATTPTSYQSDQGIR